jgi:hypothetical protein
MYPHTNIDSYILCYIEKRILCVSFSTLCTCIMSHTLHDSLPMQQRVENRRIKIFLFDHVVIKEGQLDSWYISSKSGELMRRHAVNMTLEELHKRFIKLSLANPMNTERMVAVLYYNDGSQRTIDKTQWDHLMLPADGVWKNADFYNISKSLIGMELSISFVSFVYFVFCVC